MAFARKGELVTLLDWGVCLMAKNLRNSPARAPDTSGAIVYATMYFNLEASL